MSMNYSGILEANKQRLKSMASSSVSETSANDLQAKLNAFFYGNDAAVEQQLLKQIQKTVDDIYGKKKYVLNPNFKVKSIKYNGLTKAELKQQADKYAQEFLTQQNKIQNLHWAGQWVQTLEQEAEEAIRQAQGDQPITNKALKSLKDY